MSEDTSNIKIFKQNDSNWVEVNREEYGICLEGIKLVPKSKSFISLPITDTTALYVLPNNTYKLVDLIENKVFKIQIIVLPRHNSNETIDNIIEGLEYSSVVDKRSLVSGLKSMNSNGFCHNRRGCSDINCIVKARLSKNLLEDKLFTDAGIPKRLNCTNKYTTSQMKVIKNHMINGLNERNVIESSCCSTSGCNNSRCIVKARMNNEEWIILEDSIILQNGLEPRVNCDTELDEITKQLIDLVTNNNETIENEDNESPLENISISNIL